MQDILFVCVHRSQAIAGKLSQVKSILQFTTTMFLTRTHYLRRRTRGRNRGTKILPAGSRQLDRSVTNLLAGGTGLVDQPAVRSAVLWQTRTGAPCLAVARCSQVSSAVGRTGSRLKGRWSGGPQDMEAGCSKGQCTPSQNIFFFTFPPGFYLILKQFIHPLSQSSSQWNWSKPRWNMLSSWFWSPPADFMLSFLYVKNSHASPLPSVFQSLSRTNLCYLWQTTKIYLIQSQPWEQRHLECDEWRPPSPLRNRKHHFNTPSQEQWTGWQLLDLMGWGGDKDACSAALTDGGAAPPPTGHPPSGSQNKWLLKNPATGRCGTAAFSRRFSQLPACGALHSPQPCSDCQPKSVFWPSRLKRDGFFCDLSSHKSLAKRIETTFRR